MAFCNQPEAFASDLGDDQSQYLCDNINVRKVGHQTCDLQVVGSSPGWAPLLSGLGQTTYTCVLLLPSSLIWYRPRGWSLARKV